MSRGPWNSGSCVAAEHMPRKPLDFFFALVSCFRSGSSAFLLALLARAERVLPLTLPFEKGEVLRPSPCGISYQLS